MATGYLPRHRRVGRPQVHPGGPGARWWRWEENALRTYPPARQLRDLGLLVARRRIALGLTQQTLAERAGTSHSAICRLERARREPSIDLLQRVAPALGWRLVMGFADPGWQPWPDDLTYSA
jgi:HTH-type transcriptional regulator/antitoxin HipB